MPATLFPTIRYDTIDSCLNKPGNRRWNARTLAACCGEAIREQTGRDIADPSVRTIKNDIARMRGGELGYSAPIEWDTRRQTYFYAEKGFSIKKIPLSREELRELKQITSIWSQFGRFKNMEPVRAAVEKLEMALRTQLDDTPPIIDFEKNELAVGLHWIDPLYRHILHRHSILIEYCPFIEPTPVRILVSPYLIKEYNNRWFLIGFDHAKKRIRTWGLDRILQLEKHWLEPHYRDPAFRPEYYFKQVIGVSVPDDAVPEVVRFWASPEQAKYIETKPLHPSQRVVERSDDGVIFELTVIVNYELESRIFSFGEKVKLLAPESLCERFAQRVKVLFRHYKKD